MWEVVGGVKLARTRRVWKAAQEGHEDAVRQALFSLDRTGVVALLGGRWFGRTVAI